MIYERYREVYEKAKELAVRESVTFSELVAKALGEYVEAHYPGNPQMSLESFSDAGLKPLRLEAKMLTQKAERFLEKLGDPRISNSWRRELKTKRLPQLLVKLSRLNLRLRDDEISGLVERGERACFGDES